MYLSNYKERIYDLPLSQLSNDKILISCLNAHCFNILQKDILYRSALKKSDVILPDGIAIVCALRFLTGTILKKISGHMLFAYEMEHLKQINGKCFFLGSCKSTYSLIKMRGEKEFPNITMDSYSPPFRKEFSEEETQRMINSVNAFQPDVLRWSDETGQSFYQS